MSIHIELTPSEAADRLAIRELFDVYAHCADRRDAEGQKALSPVFDDLNRYEATMHFNGQSTVTIDGVRATGESYTIAHHVFTEDGSRQMMVAWLRYLDVFSKIDKSWYFAERSLILEWSETRAPNTPAE